MQTKRVERYTHTKLTFRGKQNAMSLKMNVLAAQFKPKKGDYNANLHTVGQLFAQISQEKIAADVLVLPETAMSGYFLEGGVREVARSSEELFRELNAEYLNNTDGAPLDIVVGFYEQWQRKYYNSCLYATLGREGAGVVHTHRKFFLPTYGVFDEKRFVTRGRVIDAFPTRFDGTKVALLICEDIWHSVSATIAALKGAQILYVVSASPGRGFADDTMDTVTRYKEILTNIADEHGIWVVYCGLVGFEGGKGFTGASRIADPFAVTRLVGPVNKEALLKAEIDLDDVAVARANSPLLGDLESNLADITLELQSIEREAHFGNRNPI